VYFRITNTKAKYSPNDYTDFYIKRNLVLILKVCIRCKWLFLLDIFTVITKTCCLFLDINFMNIIYILS